MPLCYFNVIDVSRDDTETPGSEQDSEPELPGDVIEPLLCSKKFSYDFLHLYDSKNRRLLKHTGDLKQPQQTFFEEANYPMWLSNAHV
jgi:hypothetical protein